MSKSKTPSTPRNPEPPVEPSAGIDPELDLLDLQPPFEPEEPEVEEPTPQDPAEEAPSEAEVEPDPAEATPEPDPSQIALEELSAILEPIYGPAWSETVRRVALTVPEPIRQAGRVLAQAGWHPTASTATPLRWPGCQPIDPYRVLLALLEQGAEDEAEAYWTSCSRIGIPNTAKQVLAGVALALVEALPGG